MRSLVLLSIILASLATHQAHSAPPLQKLGNYDIIHSKSANAWLEIDVKTFENNIKQLQAKLSDQTKICAVMKADAYGHGIDLLMPSVMTLGVPCIGIASNDEAKIARLHGYKGVIARVRTASLDEIETGFEYDIEELIGDFEHAQAVSTLAKKHGKTLSYHLALNAGGMNRNGLEMSTDAGKQDALELVKLPNLKLVGIMTHYAFEEEDFIRQALAKFTEQSDWLIKTAKLDRHALTLHTANSFATITVPESHLDMVRPGGIIYGDTIATTPAYEPIMSFKSKVASVNEYKAGTSVGYDGTFVLDKDAKLANLPFGYSDGYRRVFTNKGFVLINGKRVPVVGKVSMNTTMVDVSALPEVKAGDEAVIYGVQGSERITQSEIEDINGALLADLYTIWGTSNPRFVKP